VDTWVSEGGTCDDLSRLPDLEFELGGVKLSLPAETYIGQAYGEIAEDISAFMPNYKRTELSSSTVSNCQPLIMTIDVDSDDGPMWILGMPFFRKYYTNFQFNNSIAGSMAFSVADENCEPGFSPATADLLMGLEKSGSRPAQMLVDASKIRLPGPVTRSKALSKLKEMLRV